MKNSIKIKKLTIHAFYVSDIIVDVHHLFIGVEHVLFVNFLLKVATFSILKVKKHPHASAFETALYNLVYPDGLGQKPWSR